MNSSQAFLLSKDRCTKMNANMESQKAGDPARRMRLGISVTGAVVVVLLAMFVWPTRWRYETLRGTHGEALPVRIDRFTGSAEVLTISGWNRAEPHESKPYVPPPEPKPQDLPQAELDKITGRGGLSYGGGLWDGRIYNGTDWKLTELTIRISIKTLSQSYRESVFISSLTSKDVLIQVDKSFAVQGKGTSPDWTIESAKGWPPGSSESGAGIEGG